MVSPGYQPTWNSLRNYPHPTWFQQAKFGIYTHWGVYSVPACGPNVTWYPYNMYRKGTPQYEHHVKTYGDPARFGYKDFIPMFRGERFDPEEWADLFRQAGARFAGPVGEHHDGFCMWDTQYSKWNAARMGPRCDVVGELAKAIRGQGMRFMVALHHAENWWFYPHWNKAYDTSDPQYSGFYGPPHDLDGNVGPGFFDQSKPSRAFLEGWKGKIVELIDRYEPDMLWFDFGIERIQERYKQDMLAFFYNRAVELGKEVVVTYKIHHLPPGVGVVDLELGRFGDLTYNDWITDTTVDRGEAWGYMRDATYKSLSSLIHYLVDNVSKNGYLLLNVGPKPNGEIPEQAQSLLKGIGKWLEVNGEAIYETVPWVMYGEGPTHMTKSGDFMENEEVKYTAQDIRFTVKDDALFAICLGVPKGQVIIHSLKNLYEEEIRSVKILGQDIELVWSLDADGLKINLPELVPGENAVVFKILRKHPFGD